MPGRQRSKIEKAKLTPVRLKTSRLNVNPSAMGKPDAYGYLSKFERA